MKLPEGYRITLMGEAMELSPWGTIHISRSSTLLLADPHIGKSAHFRKHGIPTPQGADRELIERLETLCAYYGPDRVIVVGDLAHSSRNKEWDRFLEWRRSHHELAFELVRGNHDILSAEDYRAAEVRVREPGMELAPFRLYHHPCSVLETGSYVLSGHLHPGLRFGRRKKERMTLSCFWFGPGGAVLPAFNPFAGMGLIPKGPNDSVYLLAADAIFPFNPGEADASRFIA